MTLGSKKLSHPLPGDVLPSPSGRQRVLLSPQPIHGWAKHRSQDSGNHSRGFDWIPDLQLAQRTLCCLPGGIRRGVVLGPGVGE